MVEIVDFLRPKTGSGPLTRSLASQSRQAGTQSALEAIGFVVSRDSLWHSCLRSRRDLRSHRDPVMIPRASVQSRQPPLERRRLAGLCIADLCIAESRSITQLIHCSRSLLAFSGKYVARRLGGQRCFPVCKQDLHTLNNLRFT